MVPATFNVSRRFMWKEGLHTVDGPSKAALSEVECQTYPCVWLSLLPSWAVILRSNETVIVLENETSL